MDNGGLGGRDYASLVDELCLAEGGCVTAVRGGNVDAVIRCFGGDPHGPVRVLRLPELEELLGDGDRQRIAVTVAGSAVVVVEVNGFEGSREEVLRPLSRRGLTACAFWDVDAGSQLSLADHGDILSQFEMLFPDQRDGRDPGAWDRHLDGLRFGAGTDWRASGLRAVFRATGARLGPGRADQSFRVVEISPVAPFVLPQGLADSPLLGQEPFAAYLADLGPHLVPRMRRYAFDLALRITELEDDALARVAVAEIEHPSTDREARARLNNQIAAAPPSAGEDGLLARRASLWRLLGFLLEHPDAAGGAVFYLQQVMTGRGLLVDQYWLLSTLHQAAQRAQDR
jgi:hypothetical protein